MGSKTGPECPQYIGELFLDGQRRDLQPAGYLIDRKVLLSAQVPDTLCRRRQFADDRQHLTFQLFGSQLFDGRRNLVRGVRNDMDFLFGQRLFFPDVIKDAVLQDGI